MTRSILFRIDNSQNSGLGHIARSHSIGEQLESIGHEVYYALDNSWPSEFKSREPSKNRLILINSLGSESEQEFLSSFMARNQISVLFVDSYKVTDEWFYFFHNSQIRLFSLDDSNSLSSPRILRIPYGVRYFGERERPNFSLGTKALRNVVLTSQGNPTFKLPRFTPAKRIFVYLGSSPHENEVKCVISGVLKGLSNSELDVEIVLIKSRFMSQDILSDLFSQAQSRSRIQFLLLDFCESLIPIISSCDLVIGAANTIIYHTSACLVPQITFSLNSTQKNQDFQLEQIGHYFNLGCLEDFNDDHFPSFLNLILNRLSDLKSLLINAQNRPGFDGAKNIAAYTDSSLKSLKEMGSVLELIEDFENILPIDGVFTIRAAKISDVNLILEGRNMESTRKFMIDTQKISKPSHYTWWFTNKRESFIGLTGDTPCIYIWHEVREIKGEEFLIGGWTPLCKALHFSTILEALRWQVETTSVKHPGLKWLAAVHKDNSVTQFLVSRIGFKKTSLESRFFDAAVQMFFGGVATDDYLLYSS